MDVQLTQQERKVLQDHKKHEEVCIQKYEQFAQQASDPQLQNLFSQFAKQERQHYNSLDELLAGKQPSTSGGGQKQNPASGDSQGQQQAAGKKSRDDALLCRDAMMMERFISDSYDSGIFQSTNPAVRQTLQHIQDEEQQHGEGLLNYLQSQGLQG